MFLVFSEIWTFNFLQNIPIHKLLRHGFQSKPLIGYNKLNSHHYLWAHKDVRGIAITSQIRHQIEWNKMNLVVCKSLAVPPDFARAAKRLQTISRDWVVGNRNNHIIISGVLKNSHGKYRYYTTKLNPKHAFGIFRTFGVGDLHSTYAYVIPWTLSEMPVKVFFILKTHIWPFFMY